MSYSKVNKNSFFFPFDGLVFCREQEGHSIAWSNDGKVYWRFDSAVGLHTAENHGWRRYTNYPFFTVTLCGIPEIEEAYRKTNASSYENIRVCLDGDKWCALLGADIQEGVCGFGDTPVEAVKNLTDKADFWTCWVKGSSLESGYE